MKKLSELMLEGYSMVGKQCVAYYCLGDSWRPDAVCAAGAVYFAATGNANGALLNPSRALEKQLHRFYAAVGVLVSDLNDEGMSIPDIAGIAAAEGL